ncbi:MAG: hypothetical protein A3F18_05915 [Legionellales bacterium RIFCSPHIGHO2_12_FULL_37_14]|nr:MAG: hypothetical protein A3F18_05915 [Legionellales bacterium RIFCSPHIGHO2_12_FULL_37_14]
MFILVKKMYLNELVNSYLYKDILEIDGIRKSSTINKLLKLLAFVLIPLTGYSRNLRKEISKKARYYFYDLGVRNALINQFNPLSLRNDVGDLWENYIVLERIKKQAYKHIFSSNYFWRTYSQQEIDWVEERDGKLYGYEIKWNSKAVVKQPTEWAALYKNTEFSCINPENYLDLIT